MKIPDIITILLIMCIFFAGISGCDNSAKEEKIIVAVTLLPQAEYVERVGGDRVKVTVMVPPGEDPHTYSPTMVQMTELSKAKMYAMVGSGIDIELGWMERFKAANPDMLIVDCSKGIELENPSAEQHLEDMEGQETEVETGEHEHSHSIDPHIWTSPLKAAVMVQNIADGLISIDPDNRAEYEKNRDAYLAELEELDRYIRDGLANVQRRAFMVYHPSFGHFAADYGLEQLPIEAEGKEPTPRGLQALIAQAREYNINVIFVSPQFNPQSAEVIAGEIGAKVIAVDPLARNYLDNMRQIAEQLIAALE